MVETNECWSIYLYLVKYKRDVDNHLRKSLVSVCNGRNWRRCSAENLLAVCIYESVVALSDVLQLA